MVYVLRQLSFILRCVLLFLVAFFFSAVLSQMQLSHKEQAGLDIPVWLAW